MKTQKAKELKLKAKRFAKENNLNRAEERRAYQQLKQMYKESSIKQRKELGL